MLPPLLIPVLSQLASRGLDLIGSAILSKGKDVVEKTLGVNIEESLRTEAGTEQLRMAQMTHEERLLELATADKKIDVDVYKLDVDDRVNARAREIAVLQSPDVGWLNCNLVAIISLLVIIGGGLILYFHQDNEVKFSVSNLMMLVLGYFYGTTRSSKTKDTTISNLTKPNNGN